MPHDFLVNIQETLYLLHDASGVVRGIDRKVGAIAETVPITSEDSSADRVERARPDLRALRLAEDSVQALFQLSRCLVGECDGKDLPGACRIDREQFLDIKIHWDFPVQIFLQHLHI